MASTFNLLRSLIRKIILFTLIFIVTFSFSTKSAYAISNDKNTKKLEEKIAKGYSAKFCNAIGMGMSKESSLRLAINENSSPIFNSSLWLELAISGEENIEKVETNRVIDLVSYEIINKCGYPIGLSGESGEKEFKNLLTNELLSIGEENVSK